MINTPVPTLSITGWINTTPEACDQLMADFFVAEFSQTAFYRDHVCSLPYLLEKNLNDMLSLGREVEDKLKTYFERYFPTVEIDVSVQEEKNNPDKYALRIWIEVTDDDGAKYSVANAVYVEGSKIKRIINLNNGENA